VEQDLGPETLREETAVLYSKAPIIEAVVEFRFATPLGSGPYKKLCDVFRKKYPSAIDQQVVAVQVNMDTGLPELKNSRPSLRLTTADQSEILVIQLDRIAWSRLPPYDGWNAFMGRIEPELRLMVKLVGETRFARLGLRFINRIDVPPSPDGTLRYEDYISINLPLPSCLDPVSTYQWRIDRPFPERKAAAMIQSGTMMPEIPNMGAFSLDIDAYATDELPTKIDALLARIADLRSLKNYLFELAITPLARESFT
jgi:uncharacterized protein (TIGR04255 family)